ncbi:MAG: hypothetical protein ICV66_12245 [Chitinophagaceae bacterium]|nr:hypothetical protein [Chitinophagaceae bacterium]
MNTISSSQKEDPHIELTSSEEIQESIYPHEHEVNITDGGEFLDDAIRMKDQPLRETKEMNDSLQKHLFIGNIF